MTATTIPTLLAPEVAVILRARLGPLRAWGDFLADCIRERADIAGLTLLPCGRVLDRCWRPIYAVADVEEFIVNVVAAVPAAGKTPIRPVGLEIDRNRHWLLNRFNRHGQPITGTPAPKRPRRAPDPIEEAMTL